MADQYYVSRNGSQTGPYDLAALRSLAAGRQLVPGDLVSQPGASGWVPASALRELADVFGAPPLPGLPPLPAVQFVPAPAPAGWGNRNLSKKQIFGALLGAVVLVAICARAVGDGDGSGNSTTSTRMPSTSVAGAPPGPSSAPPAAPAGPAIGETFRNGQYSYTLDRVTLANSAGSDFARIAPEEGSTFILVEYTETNNGSETEHVFNAPMAIRDAQGRRYTPSSRVDTALSMSGGGTDLIGELQPGVRHRGRTGFEVPAEAVAANFNVVFIERGVLGTNEVVIAVAPPAPTPTSPGRRGR